MTWEEDYSRRRPVYERLCEEVLFALRSALVEADIKAHSVSGRVKTLSSLTDKAQRKHYESPLDQAPDVVGARVVVRFLTELPRVAEVIHREFDVVAADDTVERDGDPSTFGYMSQHFTATFGVAHAGRRYDALRDIRFEVQVRTLLMDAWANVSHYLAYKSGLSIPKELQKDFYALSGLFYVADKHFELFLDRAVEVQQNAEDRLAAADQQVELNLDTLTAFLHRRFPTRERSSREAVGELADELLQFGFATLEDVDAMLTDARSAFEKYERQHPPATGEKFEDVGVVRISLGEVNPAYNRFMYEKYLGTGESDHSD